LERESYTRFGGDKPEASDEPVNMKTSSSAARSRASNKTDSVS